MTKIIVEVMPKAEILDPQGQAITRALHRQGFTDITDVRQGKRFELTFQGELSQENIDAIAADILTNTVIEDYTVRVW